MEQQLLRKNFLGFLIVITFCLIVAEQANAQSKLWGMASHGGIQFGTIFSIAPGATYLTDQHNLTGTVGSSPYYTNLIQGSDGKLYGMTYNGGTYGAGVIFQYDPVANTYIKKIDLSSSTGDYPSGSLLQASDGKIYGMTCQGGSNDAGVIFQYDPVTNSYTKKIDLSPTTGDNPYGSLILASDGKLYGMTSSGGVKDSGVIFQYDPSTNIYVKKIDLSRANGYHPYGSLINASDGKLYGMTYAGGASDSGVIFQYDPFANIYTKKIDLSRANGYHPYGSIMQANNGKLYGMAYSGGAKDSGVIFQYDPAANSYTKKIDLSSSTGDNPYGSLIQASDGKLYGMTYRGGVINGVIFQYDPVSNSYIKKIDLPSINGCNPYGSLIQASDGKLYGMTRFGGTGSGGVIFQYDPVTNNYTKKIDFSSTNGSYPYGSLMQANDGKLYGMTYQGGSTNRGVIFQYDPVANSYTNKIDIFSSPGTYPQGSLIQASDGKLYGMNYNGGGSIFQYDPVTNSYTIKIVLSSSTGYFPYGSLMQASDGKLYGMTSGGGANNSGVIFQYDPLANIYTKKIDLSLSSGSHPYGSLIQASNGKLYGMTSQAGANNAGVIFQYDPVTNSYTRNIDLSYSTGSFPFGSLIQASDGKLYGMTEGGGANNVGVIFQYDPVVNSYTKKIDLSSTTGGNPRGSLMQASDSKLYGMTGSGGANIAGVIFQYDPISNTYSKMLDFNYINGAAPQYGNLIEVYSFNIKIFIQGYYADNGKMNAALYKSSISSNPNEVDTVQVSLVDSVTHNIVQVTKGVLQTNGALTVNFPGSVVGHKYYLKINHRNAIETWSKYTVLMSSTANYDFTNGASQAYGNNMVKVDNISGKDVFAFWSGDVYDDAHGIAYVQDGAIVSGDYAVIESDYQRFLFGYFTTDVTGDGAVESADYGLIEGNYQRFIFKVTPW